MKGNIRLKPPYTNFSKDCTFRSGNTQEAFQAKATGYLAASFFYLQVLDEKPSNDHENHNGNDQQQQAHARAATFGALVQNCKSLLHTLNETNFVSVFHSCKLEKN